MRARVDSGAFPAIVHEGFSIQVEERDNLRLKITGNADLGMLPVLEPYLGRLHEEILRVRLRRVIVDLVSLYFMNSACFKSFVTWISTVGKLDPPQQYKVQFLANSKLHWQKRNLEALREFAPEVVEVVEVLSS